ncbi:MAG: glutamate decarboxylase [Chloroflexi bacterium]|nr:MAG: glutamate decarboxylase [Chloroflexota bacterium]
MISKKVDLRTLPHQDTELTPTYAARGLNANVPRYRLPKEGMLPRIAYTLIHDELLLDGNARLNLATFVTTWMEPEAQKLMTETFDKNMIDKDEYPQTAEIENRCVNIIARLWNAPEQHETVGTSTIGSSEAAMLSGMALKWRWRARMQAQGKPAAKPNLVMGINVQVCWEKFTRYWEIEPRFVPIEDNRYHLSAEEAIKYCDENTIGVVAILGSTFDGSYEPIKEISAALDRLQAEKGLDIPIHVDAASGGFVAPFIQPDLEWVVAQYYNFLRLGMDGYTRIQRTCQDIALYLSDQIAKLGPFSLITDGSDLPVFAWQLKSQEQEETNFTLFDMSERLRYNGWLVPAYIMPKNCEDLIVQRIVVKEGFSRDMADILLRDMRAALQYFASQPGHTPKRSGSHFAHL